MDVAEIVMSHVQAHGGGMIGELFEKPSVSRANRFLSHAEREVLALNVAGRDVRGGAAYYVTAYRYYFNRRAPARSIFYG
jgi:hypothetical protein